MRCFGHLWSFASVAFCLKLDHHTTIETTKGCDFQVVILCTRTVPHLREAGETAALLLAADQQRNLGEMIDATETAERALALACRTGNARHEEEAPRGKFYGREIWRCGDFMVDMGTL